MINSAIIPIACPWEGIPEAPIVQKKMLGWLLLKRTIFQLNDWSVKRVYLLHRESDRLTVQALTSDLQVQGLGINLVPVVPTSKQDSLSILPTGPFLLVMDGAVYNPECGGRLQTLNFALGKSVPLMEIRSSHRFTGLALCTPDRIEDLISHCLAAWRQGHSKEFMSSLFPCASSSPVEGKSCCGIVQNSRRARRRAEHLLLEQGRKPSDGFVAAHFNRHISLFISKYLLRMHVSPMLVTLSNLLVALVSCWFIARGGYLNGAIGGLLFQISSILDGCDGEIARINHCSSEAGARLDNLCDIVTLLVFSASLPIGIFRATGSPTYLIVGGTGLCSVVVYYLLTVSILRQLGIQGNRVQLVKVIEEQVRRKERSGLTDRIAARMAFIVRHDFLAALIFVLLLANCGAFLVVLLSSLVILQMGYFVLFWQRLHKEGKDKTNPSPEEQPSL
jgi:phosphatidylglycerophosphate synthase